MRYHVYDIARYSTGAVAYGKTLTVYSDAAGTTEATLYSAATGSTTLANPLTVPATGIVNFWVTDPHVYSVSEGETTVRDLFATSDSVLPVNPMDFGVKADGSTDDTTALQAAIDACDDGAVLLLPAGTIIFDQITIDNGISLVGLGRRATILKTTCTSGTAIDIKNGDTNNLKRTLSGFYLQGNGGTEACDLGISFTDSSSTTGYVTMEQVQVGDLAGTSSVGIAFDEVNDLAMTGCFFEGNGTGMQLTWGTYDAGLVVANNCGFSGDVGLDIDGSASTTKGFDSAVFNGSYFYGITAAERIAKTGGLVTGIQHNGCHYEMSGDATADSAFVQIYDDETAAIPYTRSLSWRNMRATNLDSGVCGAVFEFLNRDTPSAGPLFRSIEIDGLMLSGMDAGAYVLKRGTSLATFRGCRASNLSGSWPTVADFTTWTDDATTVGGWTLHAFPDTGGYFDMQGALKVMGKRVTAASAAPTVGTWAVGDRVYHTAPTAGGYIGWVCTTAGSPGTWNTFGAVTA